MSFTKDMRWLCSWLLLTLLGAVSAADVLVQLNVNRPLTDVNEKFVSFAVRPEDLYKALDGPNRKTLTRMASMLGDSHIRFVGEYFFASTPEAKLRNPTKIIWKGFNRWTRAVNWTMIIPVPYEPGSWDPMVALKILNSSYQLGISDCIWQLGTDFGTSAAKDYVEELKIMHLMVDSFKPYVDGWAMMGADISAGSNAEETRRYVDMSKDLNTAFGWAQPSNMIQTNSLANYINPNDAALRVLLGKKVPIWLSLPEPTKLKKTKQALVKRAAIDETMEGLRWAQTLGEAATSGFNAVFKRLSLNDLENPSFSFYVTALFKKVMGSRVFSARPLHVFATNNKLYTHCANSISGGISFLLVNLEASPKDIVLRSLPKMSTSEVWQYSLTQKKGVIYLNDEKLTLNSTMRPQKKGRNPENVLQLSAPGTSVTFWVLPNVDLEHCQYMEIEASEVDASSEEKTLAKRSLTSSDKLIKQLIQESALPHSLLSKLLNRRRRYATFAPERTKRFVLEDKNQKLNGFGKLFEPLNANNEKVVEKRESIDHPSLDAFDWFSNLLGRSLPKKRSLRKREARSTEDFFGQLFDNKESKSTAITKKITEIRRPEKKNKKLFNAEEFDEEEYFKKVGDQIEPEYTRLPDGDVHLKHIATPDGEEIEEGKEPLPEKKPRKSDKEFSKEAVSETKPLRLLPTELYEALPDNPFKTAASKINIGTALNSLLFAEPFSKKTTKTGASKVKSSPQKHVDPLLDIEEIAPGKFEKGSSSTGQLAKDFLQSQKELSRSIFGIEETKDSTTTEATTLLPETTPTSAENEDERNKQEARLRLLDILTENLEEYFHERETKTKRQQSDRKDIIKKDLKDIPWWDFGPLYKKRKTRALKFQVPDEAWQHNMITKDEEFVPLGAVMPEDLRIYQYQSVLPNHNSNLQLYDSESEKNIERPQRQLYVSTLTSTAPPQPEINTPKVAHKIVATVQKKVTNLVKIVARHVQSWYNTLAKHVDTSMSS